MTELVERLRHETQLAAVFNCINTRLIIQTGINLKAIEPEQDRNHETIEKVQTALKRMGVHLES